MAMLSRRAALATIVACGTATRPAGPASAEDGPTGQDTAPISATEDLLREHGVLNRLMLVYEEAISPAAMHIGSIHEVLHGAASLIRRFVEDYHGMLEEKYLFPEFDRHVVLGSLVKTLREQHRVGRALTGIVLRHATEEGLADETTRAEVTRACRDFVRMFRAHEAWEDTELFPTFRRLVSPSRLRELGELFEEIEHREFGGDGFAKTVEMVARLEHHLGISGPDAFTTPNQDQQRL